MRGNFKIGLIYAMVSFITVWIQFIRFILRFPLLVPLTRISALWYKGIRLEVYVARCRCNYWVRCYKRQKGQEKRN